jgi:hypothetical protein
VGANGLSTPYDPSTSFSGTSKRLEGWIQEIRGLIQTMESTFEKERGGLTGMIEEVAKVLERVAGENSEKAQESDRKCISLVKGGWLM